ncbi:GGDEF domain-containing protein [Massilia sp. KIM]|uniref:GGDEF domain-containing protein n=1 Tax=Massilia sp. KIM TaxID=1955422 RepID=UPI00098F50A7|nr:GGDEF domain-containing protein [Massilia sp. KIM]OON63597.1 GGDEF domain-containing protein [Massilia sp. KIM]
MRVLAFLLRLLAGSERSLRRMLQYWAATAVLYLVCIALLLVQVESGISEPAGAFWLTVFGGSGALLFYLLIRLSPRLRISTDQLAVSQAAFSLVCAAWAYAVSGPLRAAMLSMTVVIIAFCMFAARPRQTLALAAGAIACMGATMWWLATHDPLHFPPLTEAITFGYLSGALLSIAILTVEMSKLRAYLQHKKRELTEALETIRVLASVDELTALVNRRRMNEVLEEEQRRQPQGAGTCVALLDIDFFKQVNDRHGHAAGDAVLRHFAATARAALREQDVLARWGGEEFLLLLPDTRPADARLVLERMAARVHAMRVPGLEERRISFSAGLAARDPGETFADAITRADKALYRAKEAGRDRIEQA